MVGVLTSLFSIASAADEGAASAPAADIAPALPTKVKGAKWDPKGGAIDIYGRGDAKRKQAAWEDAIPLLVESTTKQPGCGKCLNSLAISLTGAKRYADAALVGERIALLYPDRGEGWARVADAWEAADELEKAADAATKYLAIKKDDATYWAQRNADLVALGRVSEASELLKGAAEAGLGNEDTKCLEVQNLASEGKTVDARDIFPVCMESKNLNLKRLTEGWLLLAEGNDLETAVTRLTLAKDSPFVKLVIAYVRLDQGKFKEADNLSAKVLTDKPAALDAHLAHAEAQLGLGNAAEAQKILDAHFMGDGWAERNAKLTQTQVLLRMRGPSWPAEVGLRAEIAAVATKAAQGDGAGAAALADAVAKANPDAADLGKRLSAARNTVIGNTGVSAGAITSALAASPAFTRCQAKAKPGTVVYGFTLGADGKVTDAKTVSRTITAPDVEKCTLAELGKLKLAVAEGAAAAPVTLAVNYPVK